MEQIIRNSHEATKLFEKNLSLIEICIGGYKKPLYIARRTPSRYGSFKEKMVYRLMYVSSFDRGEGVTGQLYFPQTIKELFLPFHVTFRVES